MTSSVTFRRCCRFLVAIMVLIAVGSLCLAGSSREGAKNRARQLLERYELIRARAVLEPMLREGPEDSEVYLLAGRVGEEMGDGPLARRHFSMAAAIDPENAEARCYLARSLLGARDFAGAARNLKLALKLAPDSPLPFAMGGLYYLQKGQYDLSRKYVEKALAIDPRSKEASLVLADLRFLRRDLEGAKRSISKLLDKNPQDPDGLYMMGIVLYNERKFQDAQDFLERSAAIHRYAANFLKDLAQVYAQNGHLQKAIDALGRVLDLSPGDESAISLRQNLKERRRLQQRGLTRTEGPFRFVYPPGMSEQTFRTIHEIFRDAYDVLCKQTGHYPSKVNIWVFERTGSLLPAFYSHVSDEIIISREYFSSLNSSSRQQLGRHLVFHEFSHLVLFQALGRPAFSPMALWLMEGLAEWQAGGYDYTQVDYLDTFSDGLMDFTELSEYLPVSAVGAGSKREKAYIQAYLMVDYVIRSRGGMETVKKMVLEYASGKSDREVLADAGLSGPRHFLETVSSYVQQSYY